MDRRTNTWHVGIEQNNVLWKVVEILREFNIIEKLTLHSNTFRGRIPLQPEKHCLKFHHLFIHSMATRAAGS